MSEFGDIFDFNWSRDRAGYRLVDDKQKPKWAEEGSVGYSWSIVGISKERQAIKPLDVCPDLVEQFAKIDGSSEAVIKFCDAYGILFGGDSMSLSDFLVAQERVKFALNIIRRDVSKEKKERVRHYEATRDHKPNVGKLRRGATLDEASELINYRNPTHLLLKLVRGDSGYTLQAEPRSLWDAIMLGLAKEIAGEIQWEVCSNPTCGKRFPTGPGGLRSRGSRQCSQECVEAVSKLKRRGISLEDAPIILAERPCEICGAMFKPKQKRSTVCGQEACKQAKKRRNGEANLKSQPRKGSKK